MKKLAIIYFLFIVKVCWTQTPQIVIDNFFTTFKVNASKAIKDLYVKQPWFSSGEIENFQKEIKGLEKLGTFHGYSFLQKETLKDTIAMHVYLVKYERQAIRFVFEFYKPTNQWRFQGFTYYYNPSDKLEELALSNSIQKQHDRK